MINLLADLQRARAVSYLFIAHDLAVVRHLAHDVAVMHLGRVVESGPAADVYERARHPYTIALLSAVLTTGPEAGRPERIVLRGEMPSPATPPPGCTFHTRCFRYVELGEPALCRSDAPPLAGAPGDAHHAACHFPIVSPVLLGATPTAAVSATGTRRPRPPPPTTRGRSDESELEPRIEVIDSHTEGNLTPRVVGGVPTPPGDTVQARQSWLAAHDDACGRRSTRTAGQPDDVLGAADAPDR